MSERNVERDEAEAMWLLDAERSSRALNIEAWCYVGVVVLATVIIVGGSIWMALRP